MKLTPTLLLTALVLSGCFYEAPISEKPTRKIDPGLLGDWASTSESGVKVVIKESDPEHYAVTYEQPAKDGKKELLVFTGYHTQVGKVDIVDLQLMEPAGEQKGKWLFLDYKLTGADKLSIRSVNSEVVPMPPGVGFKGDSRKLATPAETKAFFESVIDNPDLFRDEPMEFVRAK